MPGGINYYKEPKDYVEENLQDIVRRQLIKEGTEIAKLHTRNRTHLFILDVLSYLKEIK